MSGCVVLIDDIVWDDPAFFREDPKAYEGWLAIVGHDRVVKALEINNELGAPSSALKCDPILSGLSRPRQIHQPVPSVLSFLNGAACFSTDCSSDWLPHPT